MTQAVRIRNIDHRFLGIEPAWPSSAPDVAIAARGPKPDLFGSTKRKSNRSHRRSACRTIWTVLNENSFGTSELAEVWSNTPMATAFSSTRRHAVAASTKSGPSNAGRGLSGRPIWKAQASGGRRPNHVQAATKASSIRLSRSIGSKITEQVPRVASCRVASCRVASCPVASCRETGNDSTKKPPCGGPFVQTNPKNRSVRNRLGGRKCSKTL